MNDFDILLNARIISYFKTGNPLIDGFILMFMASLTSYVFSKKHKIIKLGRNTYNRCFLNKYKYKIKLLSFETSTSKYNPGVKSSISYNSVNFCIKNVMKCDIKEITENFNSFKKFGSVYEDFDDKLQVHNKNGYDITQTEIFQITKNIYGRYNIEIEEGEKGKDLEKLSICGKKKYLTLMTNTSLDDITIFIEECIKKFDKFQKEMTNKGPFIFTYKGMKSNNPVYEEKYFRTLQTFENSVFDCKEELFRAVSKFRNEKYYIKHPHITRKLIPLFYGEPGTGKTFAIRLIAKELNRNIIIVPLNKIRSIDELNAVMFFKKINDHKLTPDKCVFIIEDLDAMTELLKNRKYQPHDQKEPTLTEVISLLKTEKKDKTDTEEELLTNKSTLTMSDVLNTLDGVYKLDNYVIAFSTNHIEQLDPAFLRDQRITHKIEFKKCSKKVLKEIIEQWYEVELSKQDLLRLKNDKLTLANIATLCDKCDTYKEVLNLI